MSPGGRPPPTPPPIPPPAGTPLIPAPPPAPPPDAAPVDRPSGRHLYDPVLAMVADRADANCRLSLELMALVARRDIAAGETISNDFHAAAAQRSIGQQR